MAIPLVVPGNQDISLGVYVQGIPKSLEQDVSLADFNKLLLSLTWVVEQVVLDDKAVLDDDYVYELHGSVATGLGV